MKIRLFEAFAGYGSQALAMDRIKEAHSDFEYEVVGISEIDKYAVQAYEALHGSVKNYGDISKIDWSEVPNFDMFTYSSPCQDWSNAGLQKGGAEGSGTRSSLLWECKRAIIAKKPKYCMLENVKALTSKKFLPYFLQWCDWLTEQGYRNFWKVLNAKDYGVPQNRERVFLFSILDENARYVFPKPFELKNCLADLLEPSVSEEFYLSEKSVEGFRLHNENHEKKGTGFV